MVSGEQDRGVFLRPPKLVKVLGFPLVCLALFSVAGGYWAVLQTVAWAQMLRDYSRTGTFSEAVSKTFDGEHPCALCCKVKEGRAKEDRLPATGLAVKKAEVFVAAVFLVLSAPLPRRFCYPRVADLLFAGRADAPPAPVPIAFVS